MTSNRLRLSIVLMLAVLFWLNACDGNKIGVAGTETLYFTATKPTVTPTFPPAPTLTAIPLPKLPIIGGTLISPEQELRLTQALQSANCELPCYLGITPGKTSWASAQQILADLGAEYRGGDKSNMTVKGMPAYSYKILVNDTTSDGTVSTSNTRHPLDITLSLNFLVKDSIVQRVYAHVDSLVQELKFQNYISRYSPQQIFTRLGKPDAIYYSPKEGNGMILVYKSRGVRIEFAGKREGDSVCPNFEFGNYAERRFVLINVKSDLSIFPEKDDPIQLTDREFWLPVNELFGVSQENFFNQVIANPSVCFDMKTVAP
jgi:hypothetical protein